jgi:hypothetical protein
VLSYLWGIFDINDVSGVLTSGLDGCHRDDCCLIEYAPCTLQKFASSSEDGSSRFLRNFGKYLAGCTTSRLAIGCAAFFMCGVCGCKSSDRYVSDVACVVLCVVQLTN